MTYEILYKRTKTGAIQQYNICVLAVLCSGSAIIVKESGQLGGKQIKHEEFISEGKNIGKSNETTPYEQACLQAQSDWLKKKDGGYKSLKDLNIKLDINDGRGINYFKDGTLFCGIGYCLDAALPQFNTGISNIPLPMLAKAVNWDKVTYPCYIQPKLDGVRCLMVSSINKSRSPSTVFLSRSGKEYITLNHIRIDVDSHQYSYMPGEFILDGEIYSDELTFQEIVSAVKKQKPDSLKLHFRAYDIVNDKKQYQRIEQVRELVDRIDSNYIQYVITVTASVKDDIIHHYNKWVSEGNEGAMIRHYNGIYGQGQRSSDLLKVKEFNDAEFEFISFEKGQRDEDLIAVCKNDAGEFKAKMIGTVTQKQKLFIDFGNNKFDNVKLTIKYFGLTDSKLPRFPIGIGFRNYE